MRSMLSGLTTRGTSFLAAGIAAVLAGLVLGERPLLSIGVVLAVLPLLATLAASRARYRLSCVRFISPARIPAGQAANVTLRLENVSKLPTSLMLAEDTVPYSLGTRPRYVLNGIERGGVRELSYPLRSDLRGKFEIGPLEIRITDAFGVAELGRSFSARTTFVVTPRVVPLARTAVSRSWVGDGDGRTRATTAAGEDDAIPRAYRDGDELRRVHWRSTARYGELMVRREEQRWKNRALLLLDARRLAHAGSGATSSFEYAVSAAASMGVHMAGQGLEGQLVTDAGPIASAGIFEDVLLDSLAVIKTSTGRDLGRGLAALRADSGLIVAIAGRLSTAEARQLAACRREGCQAIALLLAVSTWADPGRASERQPAAVGRPGQAGQPDGQLPGSQETAAASAVLRAAGWRVISIEAGTSLETAWQRLPGAADLPTAHAARAEAAR